MFGRMLTPPIGLQVLCMFRMVESCHKRRSRIITNKTQTQTHKPEDTGTAIRDHYDLIFESLPCKKLGNVTSSVK